MSEELKMPGVAVPLVEPEITVDAKTLERLRLKARKEIQDDLRGELEDKIYAQMRTEERAKFELQEELVSITVSVPSVNIIDPLSGETGVRINNKIYKHGITYHDIPRSLAGMIAHSCFCANRNENAIGNPNRDYNIHKRVDARNPSAPAQTLNTRSSILGV
jgi:hypothetical protein